MRITNQMMTNSMLGHINGNKRNMSKLESQYSSGKKIQRPSDDPIIAVRALKLRSNLTELSQYVEKNIPDAESWMEVTESAMDNMNDIIRAMNTYCVQGSSDTLTAKERTNILQNLTQLKEQIYQEGNSQYAGRYVFTGYKTDKPLIYTSGESFIKNVNLEVRGDTPAAPIHGATTYDLAGLATNLSGVSKITIDDHPPKSVVTMSRADFDALAGGAGIDANTVYYLEDQKKLVFGGTADDDIVATSVIRIEAEQYAGYEITEKFTGEDMKVYSTVTVPERGDAHYPIPYEVSSNRIQLSYDNIFVKKMVNERNEVYYKSSVEQIQYTTDGITMETMNVKTISSLDPKAYEPGDDEVYLLADTGELIFGRNKADIIKDAKEVSITYNKSQFGNSELRPEHFFDCKFTTVDNETTTYHRESQDITYEVNFGQVLKVNTEAKDVIRHDINRLVDDITTAVNRVASLEAQIADIDNQLSDSGIASAVRNELQEQRELLDKALVISKSTMQKSFSQAITATNKFQDTVNVAIADLGSRSKRLELTKTRLEDQQVELEDLKSSNEDVDLVETVIRYKSAESLYTSSLQAAAAVIKTNLLNFL